MSDIIGGVSHCPQCGELCDCNMHLCPKINIEQEELSPAFQKLFKEMQEMAKDKGLFPERMNDG